MQLEELKTRLSTRAKAFVSDPDLVTDDVLGLAGTEALALAGAESPEPVVVDIAYHRLLLQLGINVDEVAQKAYRLALSQVSDPQAPNAPTTPTVKQRDNPYQ